MATLDQYAKLANDEVVQGVFENIITANELMPFLKFKGFNGNSLVYNRELVLPTSSTHVVGDAWTDSEPTFTKKTAALTQVGVQTPLDRFIAQTRSNVQSPEAITIASMSKSLARKIADLVITGEPTTVTSEFEGLDSLLRSETRMMAMDDGNVDGPGTAETELTLDRLDAMIDQVENGGPEVLIMNKTMRRKLTALSRSSGSGVLMDQIELFGHQIRRYNGLPIVINDFVTNAEQYDDSGTWPSSTATTIFAVKFGEDNQGYTIIHNGDVLTPDIQRLGTKFDKNEDVFRMVVYMQALTFSAKMVSALGGIDSAS